MKKLAIILMAGLLLVPTLSTPVETVKVGSKSTVVKATKSFYVTMKEAACVYGGATYSAPVIARVGKGDRVKYLGTITNNFAKVKVGDVTGYVNVDAIDAKGW